MSTEATIAGDESCAKPREPMGSVNRFLRRRLGESRHAIQAVLDQAVVSASSFATTVIIASVCGTSGLGIAHLALTLVYFTLNLQCELVIAPFMVYRKKREGGALEEYCGSVVFHQCVLIAISMTLLALLLLILGLGMGPTRLLPTLCVLLFAAPFRLMQGFLRHLSFASLQFSTALIMDTIVAILQLSTLFTLALTNSLTVPIAFLVMGASSACACIGWFVVRPAPFRMTAGQFVPHWRENWSFGRWSLSSHVVGCATTYLLPWLLMWYHNESATGMLAACSKVSALAGTLLLGVAHFITPKAMAAYADNGLRGLYRVLGTGLAIFMVTMTSFTLFVFATGDRLMVGLFGDEFADTGSITTLLSISVLVNSIAIIAGNGLWAIDRPKANLLGDASTLVAAVATALFLIGPLGPLGAAIASVAGASAGAVVRCATFLLVVREVEAGEAFC